MDEVDPNAIYLDVELREFPESLLLSAPVEFLGPIVHQIPQPFEIRPCDHGAPGALSGQRVFRMRVLRSERTCSATATLKGSIRSLGLLVSKRDRFQLSMLESSPNASRLVP